MNYWSMCVAILLSSGTLHAADALPKPVAFLQRPGTTVITKQYSRSGEGTYTTVVVNIPGSKRVTTKSTIRTVGYDGLPLTATVIAVYDIVEGADDTTIYTVAESMPDEDVHPLDPPRPVIPADGITADHLLKSFKFPKGFVASDVLTVQDSGGTNYYGKGLGFLGYKNDKGDWESEVVAVRAGGKHRAKK